MQYSYSNTKLLVSSKAMCYNQVQSKEADGMICLMGSCWTCGFTRRRRVDGCETDKCSVLTARFTGAEWKNVIVNRGQNIDLMKHKLGKRELIAQDEEELVHETRI